MKENNLRAVTWFMLLLLMACRQVHLTSPLNFKGYEGNPLLTPGEPGSWDDLLVMNASTLEHNDTIYLFYTGFKKNMIKAVGLATSTDGCHFTKFIGNPILEADQTGFDAYGVSQAEVFKEDSIWVLYYNARETAGFGMGPSIGRATSSKLTGPWTKSENPVLTSGRMGEWDAEFIQVGSILQLNDNSLVMYYCAAYDFVSQKNFLIGMATSLDGITWKKFNDPNTIDHPFADSDPIMLNGNRTEWDSDGMTLGYVSIVNGGFEMYYAGFGKIEPLDFSSQITSIGYASSTDGIHWTRFRQNPVYSLDDDPYADILGNEGTIVQTPKLLYHDGTCYMYYDYGLAVGKISVATAVLK
jgi:hypothetical protein